MSIIQSILLGIIQGLTEFLPISSSGHLVMVPLLLKWDIPPQEAFIFDVLVQVATLVAVIAYFWTDLLAILRAMLRGIKDRAPFNSVDAKTGWLLILSTIPAGVLGLFLKDTVERAFASLVATGAALLLTSLLLVIAERVGRRNRDIHEISWLDSLWIGFFQVLAIFPGVSRSGSTISGGMTRNLNRSAAARFSFLMSIPVMLAAGLLAGIDLFTLPELSTQFAVFIPGFISAALVGYLSIRWLIRYLSQHSFYPFAIYCAIVGSVIVLLDLTIL
jgi:undecaprenyl-diphosphatase